MKQFTVVTLVVVASFAALTSADPIPNQGAQAGQHLVGGHASGAQQSGQALGHGGHGGFHGDQSSQGYGRAESSNTFSFGAPLAGHGADFGGQFAAQGGHAAAPHAAQSQGQAQAH